MSDRRGRAWRIAALAAPSCLFVLGLVGVEAAVRAWLRPVPALEIFVRDPHQRLGFTDRRQIGVFVADPLLLWRLRPGLAGVIWDFTPVTTNAQGLRMDHDVGPKPPGRFRIVCLGDSVTFGYRIPVVFPDRPTRYDRDARPYPADLEHQLRLAHPGRDVEVIPMATPGYSSCQGRLWAERDLAALEPDLVTALFGWNDANLRPASDAQVFDSGPLRLFARRSVIASQAIAHAAEWLRERDEAHAAPGPGVPRVDAAELVANYRAMARAAADAGAPFVALAPVFRGADDRVEIARIAIARAALHAAMNSDGIPVLEVAALTEQGRPGNEALFGEPIHPNARGHRVLATALGHLLEGEGLLAPLGGAGSPAHPGYDRGR